jgi:hypothetical protein
MQWKQTFSAGKLGVALSVGLTVMAGWAGMYTGLLPEACSRVREALFAPPPPPPPEKPVIPVLLMTAGASDTGGFFYSPSLTVPACTKDFKIARLTVEAGTTDEKKPADIQAALINTWTQAVADQESAGLSLDNKETAQRIRSMLDGIAHDAETAGGLQTAFRVNLARGLTIAAPADDQYSNCRPEGIPLIPNPVMPKPPQGGGAKAKVFGK